MNREQMLGELEEFVVTEFLDGRSAGFDANTPLLEWGVIDSISVSMLTSFAEQRLGVAVPESEVNPQNLATLADFVSMLERQQQVTG